jgi:predicted nucleotidyltransferase
MVNIEQRIRELMYSENPRYSYHEILEIVNIPRRTLDRYRSKIWKEDEPKRAQQRLEEMKAEISVIIKKDIEPNSNRTAAAANINWLKA